MNHHVKNITFLLKHRKFKKGSELRFTPGLNVVVGENGSGKSTLLSLLSNCHNNKYAQTVLFNMVDDNSQCAINYFDTERSNPRTSALPYSGGGYGYALLDHRRSHGEALFPILEYTTSMANSLILLDEPESGLSIPKQKRLFTLLSIAAQNNQLIVATHNHYLIKATEKILSLKHCRLINSKHYLK